MSASIQKEFVETELLRVAYERRGEGAPVLLLHGWPDDVRTWDSVATILTDQGYSTIAPYSRGYGETTFRDASTERSGQVVALAQDAIDLLDALGLEKVTVVGHDWGCRAGYALAALWPERIERLIALSGGYETGIKPGQDIEPEQARAYWYQWFWNTDRGREALQKNRDEVCRFLWETWAPSFQFSDDEFETTAASWDNRDWVEIALHSYRVRWGAAPQDPRYASLEERLLKHPKISVPTTVLHGEEDGASLVQSSEEQESSFTGPYRREVLRGVGHFVPRENPRAVVDAVLGTPSS